jgi:hypothetical protein
MSNEKYMAALTERVEQHWDAIEAGLRDIQSLCGQIHSVKDGDMGGAKHARALRLVKQMQGKVEHVASRMDQIKGVQQSAFEYRRITNSNKNITPEPPE